MKTPTQVCTFSLGDYYFGVGVHDVQEVLRYQEMTSVPLAHPALTGLINLRGQIVTAIDLRRRLHLPDRNVESKPMNVVIRTTDGPMSLLVDEIGEVLELNEDTLERPPETLRGNARTVIHGVYKLKDRLLLSLNVSKTIELSKQESPAK